MLQGNNGESAADFTTSSRPPVLTAAKNSTPLSSASSEGIRTPSLPANAHPPPIHPVPVASALYYSSHHPSASQSSIGSARSSAQPPRSPPHAQLLYDEPRSPRQKLDALIAEEEQHHPSPAATTTTTHPGFPAPPARPSFGGLTSTKSSSHVPLRNVSEPVPPSAGFSPPASPVVTMPPPSRPNRPDTRPTPPMRNHSIDSAASSLSSSASQSFRVNLAAGQRPVPDMNTMNPPDMAALVAAAGSPEAAFMAVWKEKQTATNHNAQLWRLVEKQRAMIIGLQKDYERALKDKDRYRKKLKEYTNQVPPGPGTPQRSYTVDSVVERDGSQSPALSETSAKGAVTVKTTEHKVSPLTQETSATKVFPETQLLQSPTHSSETNTTSSLSSPTDLSVQPLHIGNKGLGLDAVVQHDISPIEPEETPRAVTPPPTAPVMTLSPESSLKAPVLSITHATPVIGGDGFESPPAKLSQPSRKAPPAPLNLTHPGKPSAHLHAAGQDDGDESDDYDDVLEVDEIPIVDRGRRKTREEDDRVRESMALKEEAARSKSMKQSGSKPASVASPSDQVSTTLSPQLSPHQTGLPLSPRHPPANSLNALLSPTNSESSMIAQRSIASPPLMSPGLPTSPRPGDRPIGSPLPRNLKQSLASPPMSPRGEMNGVSHLASRPPRQPVPLPPNTPQSYSSPQPGPSQPRSSDLLRPSNSMLNVESDAMSLGSETSISEYVYRGLVSDQYPGLLLPPNALPSIEVKVSSSRLRPSRLSYLAPKPQEEDPVFHLAIYARSDKKQLWRMEKTIMALPALDQQLRSYSDFQGKLPERALFSGHAPAKIDARRAALNQYFDIILETPLNENAALVVCEFFSTDVIGAQNADTLAPESAAPQVVPSPKSRQAKEGFLTKRGKNFGGWKARYFVLDGPEFKYYEMVGGVHLGTIKLQNAQIGKQSQQQSNQSPQRRDDSEDNQYRHAFLILEPKRKDSNSLVRHVLCAESDEERDAWVEALLQHVDWQEETSPIEAQHRPAVLTKPQSKDPSRARRSEPEKAAQVPGLSYDDTIAAEAPVRGPTIREAKETQGHSPKNGSLSSESSSRHLPSISGPSNGAPIQDLESWGNRPVAAPTTVKDKKRSIFGFGSRGRALDIAPEQFQQQQAPERLVQQNRNVFGIPLAEAVEYTQPMGLGDPLPAVVFRCLEYLRDKKAMNEEGIFRLSGSNIVIRALRERFNTEGDVRLVDGQYYDIHAVASLLKLYLRELPSSILTRELHLDFLKVLDMDERSKKIQSFNVLVHKLPRINFELIRHVSSFLIEIVENAAMNRMTVRNVGIVFAPTLNIPAPLISFFLTDYPDIFGSPLDEASSPIHEIRTATQLGDELRSPRHQMFSDVGTPAYSETSFQQHQQQHNQAPQNYAIGQPPQQPPPQPPHQQPQYAGYDTGFLPVRSGNDAPAYEQYYQQGEGYGSLKDSPQSGNAREQKQRRRESGMLLMGMGQRKGSNGSLPGRPKEEYRVNPMLIREETAFD